MLQQRYREVSYETCEGVYKPAEDTFLLIESVTCSGRVLEVGTGTGVVAISCAKNGFQTDATDISENALRCAKHNAEINGVMVTFFRSELFAAVSEKYDTILFNPPYLPVEDSFEGSEAWNGGPDGFGVVRKFLSQAVDHLNPGGRLFIILSDLTDIAGLIDEFPMLSFTLVGTQDFEFESIHCYRIMVR